jgi:glycosyltransferase involved in cell wall biosynthesis
MKLFFDARWTRTDYYDGVSRYGASLIEALHDEGVDVTMLIHSTKQLKLLPQQVPYKIINHPFSPLEFFLAFKLNKLGANVVFSPLQVMGSWGRKYKLILTLQDIIYYRYPKPPTFLPLPVRLVWWLFHKAYWPQRLILNQADFVNTVSKTSKKFIEQYKLTNKNVGVVYNAPQQSSVPIINDGSTKNILYIGSFMPYKNVETLIEGMAFLPLDYSLHLLSKISPERENELSQLIPQAANVVFHHGVSEADYASLLQHCFALATASKEEGFGLPIIEAQNARTPVLCSNIEIFHEVAGSGAQFFNPDSPQDFAAQLLTLEDKAVRHDLTEAGSQHASSFSWQKSARKLINIIENLK